VSFVGISALLVSIASIMFAFPNRTRDRYPLAFLLLAFHLAATVTYYFYIQSHDSDVPLYFFDPLGVYYRPTTFGTAFTIQLVQAMRRTFDGSYFDYFLAFQAVGLIGIVILSRIIAEVQVASQLALTRWATLILFLPSLHFWTSGIGKDAPLLFASSLAAWSLLRLSSRWLWFAAAMGVMVLFRPHIALIATSSLAISLLIDNRNSVLPRIIFGVIALFSLGFSVRATQSALNFDAADPNSVADFIMTQQSITSSVGGGAAVEGGFLFRLVSLLFRPFFFDANGIFGLISSLENVVFLWGFIALVRNFGAVWKRIKGGIYSRYAYVFTLVLTISLAILYYNVGLGLRQRVMGYPALLPLLVVAWGVAAERKRRSASPPAVSRATSAFGGPARSDAKGVSVSSAIHRPGADPGEATP
jgi:hypothetical protein